MVLLLSLIFIMTLMIYPIRLSARAMGASSDSYFTCFFAAVASIASWNIANEVFSNLLMSLLLGFACTGIAFSLIFNVEYKPAVVIALLTSVIQLVAVFILAVLGISWHQATV